MSSQIVHINHRYAPFIGGSERYVQEISERLACAGALVNVVTTDALDLEFFWDRSRRRVSAPQFETLNGVDIVRVSVRHLPASSVVFQGTRRLMGELSRLPVPAAPFRVATRFQPWLPGFAAAIRDARPGLIHATNLGLEGLAITAQAVAERSGAPFILTPFVHLGGRHDGVARRYVTMPHQRRLLQSADVMLTMTALEADFVTSITKSPNRVYVVGAGVNPLEVSGGNAPRFREQIGSSAMLVGSIGALAEDKGTIDLVRAIQRLRRRGEDIELVLAGAALSGFERWYTALKASERDGIHVLGMIDADTKRDMLAAIDIFALPSRTESFGIVYLEAWANGKPVIAADSGAVGELVRHGENGLLVQFGDEAAIAESVVQLANDAALRDYLGESGLEMVRNQYTWDLVFERVRHAYQQVGIGW